VGTVIVLAFAAGTTAYVATHRSRPDDGSQRLTAPPIAAPSPARPSMLARPPAVPPPVDDDPTANSDDEEAAARGSGAHGLGAGRRR